MNSKTKKAYDLFNRKEYSEALSLFKQLNKDIGGDPYSFNIEKCLKHLNKKEDAIQVVYISDNSFLLPTYVSIFSLMENRDCSLKYVINIVLNNVEISQASFFKKMSSEGFYINLIHLSEDNDILSIKKNGFHVSTSAVLKFEIPRLFPDLNKILYIDGDTIINNDVCSLFSTDITGLYAAVVEDIKPKIKYKPNILIKLSIENHRGYFNSGVLLLNLEKMRQDNITEKLIDYRKNGINFFMDQDALNVILEDKVKYLSCKKNLLVTLEESFSLADLKENYTDIEKIESYADLTLQSDIVHFASKNKPWKKSDVRHADLWNFYYIKSGAVLENFLTRHEVFDVYSNNLIVSLTSYPARIDTVAKTVESILSQSISPRKIILWLAHQQFNLKEKELPRDLLSLRSDKFEIKWCDDIRSYKKLIPALAEFKRDIIITADDDIIYEKDWVFGLLRSYMTSPDSIHCYRAHLIDFSENWIPKPYGKWKRDLIREKESYFNFFTGCGGVLYPPKSLFHHVDRIDGFQSICPTGDDIWFWGMAVLNGRKIKIASKKKFNLNFTPSSQDVALWRENDSGGANDQMLSKLISVYPGILQELQREGK